MDDTLHEDARQVDIVRPQLAGRHQLVDLRDRHLSGHGCERIEVPRGSIEAKVTQRVADGGSHDRKVGRQRRFEHVGAPTKIANFFAVRDQGTRSGRGEKSSDPSPTGAQSLGQGALRVELDGDLAGEHLLLEIRVAADEAADDTRDLSLLQQDRQPASLVAAVVRHDRELLAAAGSERDDQRLGVADEAEATDRDRGSILHVEQRGLGRLEHFARGAHAAMMQPLMAAVQTTLPRNPMLERQICEHPDSREAWQVYADWLQQQGSPYGDRIALDLQLDAVDNEAKATLEDHIAKLEAEHRASWMGTELDMYSSMPHFDEVMDLRWERGFIVEAKMDDPQRSRWFGGSASDLLKALFDAPCSRFLRSLHLHPKDPGTPSKPVEALRELVVVDPDGYWDLAHLDIGPLTAWLSLAPRLERLEATGGGIVIETLDHPRLSHVSFVTAGLPEATVRAVGRCRLPNLQVLDVYFGASRNGAEGSNDMLEELYTGDGVPRLRRLGLMNAEFQDEIAVSIAKSKLLERLTHLNLSLGTLTDAGAAAIVANAKRFGHLEVLDLSDNFISPSMCARLRSVLPIANVDEQKEPSMYGEAPEYYVSVGE